MVNKKRWKVLSLLILLLKCYRLLVACMVITIVSFFFFHSQIAYCQTTYKDSEPKSLSFFSVLSIPHNPHTRHLYVQTYCITFVCVLLLQPNDSSQSMFQSTSQQARITPAMSSAIVKRLRRSLINTSTTELLSTRTNIIEIYTCLMTYIYI